MAGKGYEDRIAEAKAALEAYSAQQNEIAKLYEQAKQNAVNTYGAQTEAIRREAKENRNSAAVSAMRTEKNLDQELAARGLAFSGENAQTKLDLTLALQNRMQEIDKQEATQQQELALQHADRLTELDLAQARERASGAEKQSQLQGNLASLEAQAHSTGGSTSSGTENADADASGLTPSIVAGLQIFRKKGEPWSVYRVRRALLLAQQKLAGNLTSGGQSDQGTQEGSTPNVSARDLAKQMVFAIGENGKISGLAQQQQMEELLAHLKQENNFSDTYYRELLLNLQSLGYRADYKQLHEQDFQTVQADAKSVYDTTYRRMYRIYQLAGMDTAESDSQAAEEAIFEQMAYVYAHSKDRDTFETYITKMRLSTRLDAFYQQVKERNLQAGNDRYVLGADLIK